MTISPLAKKLGIKPGQRVLLLNAPANFCEQLHPLPDHVQLTDQPEGAFDLAHLFARDKAELEHLTPTATRALKPNGQLWASFPKGSSKQQTDLTRDQGWEGLTEAGMGRMALISVDDVWSAWRFKPV